MKVKTFGHGQLFGAFCPGGEFDLSECSKPYAEEMMYGKHKGRLAIKVRVPCCTEGDYAVIGWACEDLAGR